MCPCNPRLRGAAAVAAAAAGEEGPDGGGGGTATRCPPPCARPGRGTGKERQACEFGVLCSRRGLRGPGQDGKCAVLHQRCARRGAGVPTLTRHRGVPAVHHRWADVWCGTVTPRRPSLVPAAAPRGVSPAVQGLLAPPAPACTARACSAPPRGRPRLPGRALDHAPTKRVVRGGSASGCHRRRRVASAVACWPLPKQTKKTLEAGPRFELGSVDSKSNVLTVTPTSP